MPKFGGHILFSELGSRRRPDLIPKVTPAMRLGAVGPDLTLFLFDPVSNPHIRQGFDAAMTVLRTVRDIKNELSRIEQIFSGPPDDLADWLTGGLSKDLSALMETSLDAMLLTAKLGVAVGISGFNFKNPIFQLIKDGVFDPQNLVDPKYRDPDFLIGAADKFGFPFRYFGHPYTDDKNWHTPAEPGDYSEWWWMDMLHYRRPGDFARSLMEIASDHNSSVMRDYATGYLSHVAGDICGHPYINSIVHGPFRNHAYRHIVLEGLVDTWLWGDQMGEDILESHFHQLIDVGSDINIISKQIRFAMERTYREPDIPRMLPEYYPTSSELQGAYQRMFMYLELSTGGTVSRPRMPPTDPGDALQELEDLLSKYAPSGAPPSWNPSNPLDYIVALLGYLLRGVVYLAMLASLPYAVAARIAALPGRWLLYLIHLGVYMIVCGLRTLLAMMGWGYASRDDFSAFGFLTDLVAAHPLDGFPFESAPSPKLPFYWIFPPGMLGAGIEKERTKGAPYSGRLMPDWLVDPNNTMDASSLLERLYSASDPKQTETAVGGLQNGFGNAVDFFIVLLEGRLPIPNFDLDGDRGYAYKPWEVLPPNERYV